VALKDKTFHNYCFERTFCVSKFQSYVFYDKLMIHVQF